MSTEGLTKLIPQQPAPPINTTLTANPYLPLSQSGLSQHTNPWALSPAEREMDQSFIRALQLLHSTDPESNFELKKLLEDQLQQSANNISTSAKIKLGLESKKLIHPVSYSLPNKDSNATKGNLKDKLGRQSSQVVVTTLSSGGVNEEATRQLSLTASKTKATHYRLSSSSSSDDEQRNKPNSTKKLKISKSLNHPELFGEDSNSEASFDVSEDSKDDSLDGLFTAVDSEPNEKSEMTSSTKYPLLNNSLTKPRNSLLLNSTRNDATKNKSPFKSNFPQVLRHTQSMTHKKFLNRPQKLLGAGNRIKRLNMQKLKKTMRQK